MTIQKSRQHETGIAMILRTPLVELEFSRERRVPRRPGSKTPTIVENCRMSGDDHARLP